MKMAFFKIEGRCQPRLLLLIFLSFLCARGPQKGWAQDQIHPSGPLIAGLEHLFKVVSPPGEVFAPEKVAALLHFVASDTPSKATFELREIGRAHV